MLLLCLSKYLPTLVTSKRKLPRIFGQAQVRGSGPPSTTRCACAGRRVLWVHTRSADEQRGWFDVTNLKGRHPPGGHRTRCLRARRHERGARGVRVRTALASRRGGRVHVTIKYASDEAAEVSIQEHYHRRPVLHRHRLPCYNRSASLQRWTVRGELAESVEGARLLSE